MGTGPCGFQGRLGGLVLPCPCAQGIFNHSPDSGTLRDTCDVCGHGSSMHEDINMIAGKSVYTFRLSDFFSLIIA